jgi:hypothetical protein
MHTRAEPGHVSPRTGAPRALRPGAQTGPAARSQSQGRPHDSHAAHRYRPSPISPSLSEMSASAYGFSLIGSDLSDVALSVRPSYLGGPATRVCAVVRSRRAEQDVPDGCRVPLRTAQSRRHTGTVEVVGDLRQGVTSRPLAWMRRTSAACLRQLRGCSDGRREPVASSGHVEAATYSCRHPGVPLRRAA